MKVQTESAKFKAAQKKLERKYAESVGLMTKLETFKTNMQQTPWISFMSTSLTGFISKLDGCLTSVKPLLGCMITHIFASQMGKTGRRDVR